MTQVDRIRAVCSLLPPDPFARPPLASTNLTLPLPSPQAATDGHPRLERRQRLKGRRRPSCVCFRHTRPPASALVCRGGGEDSHLRTVGLLCVELALVANPTSLAERHAAAGGVRRPWGTAADPILRYRMGPHRGPSAAENVACWGLSCVTPLARRVKVAPVCDQPQPRQAPPGRWGCEAAG